MMPGTPAKRLSIHAESDGLDIHPIGTTNGKHEHVHIEYRSNKITFRSAAPLSHGRDEKEVEETSVEVHGIVGLLDLVSSAYLICITDREQVAQIRGKAIYTVKDVALLPLSSQVDALREVAAAKKRVKHGVSGDHADGGEEDSGGDVDDTSLHEGPDHEEVGEEESSKDTAALDPPSSTRAGGGILSKSTTFVKDVVQDRGKYGRFAEKWFSKGGGWGASRKPAEAVAGKEEGELTKEQEKQEEGALPQNESKASTAADEEKKDDVVTEGAEPQPQKQKSAIDSLTPRIIRSAKLYFASSGFFFSYDHDLSGTLMQKSTMTSSVPLWKRFDELFFWNRHLLTPFIGAGQDALVLPLMQGFVGQRAFSIARTDESEQDVVADSAIEPTEVVAAQEKPKDESAKTEAKQEDFLLTLVSRRSVKRAGLRYLRRGIDDEGNVANSVETEQMLSTQSWDPAQKTFSLLQVRGSIPLFFSQSPFSFKPLPVMFGSETTTQAAFQKHLTTMSRRYGSIQIASLVDKHGTEVNIGEAYEHHSKLLNEHGGANGKPVDFEWFDFHTACKGMKFENVSLLMDTLQPSLRSFGWIVKQDDRNIGQQTGVLRTNCMDCLDRTNVVQSAVGGWALEKQLEELGLKINLKTDPKTQWFNTLWADNGDAISRQYAGTSALKGDFTRTRKRGWGGTLFDFSLTLNRYYNNIFSDYFLQTQIDYFLGNVGPSVFDDFETDMRNQDYAVDMKRIRQSAIDTCVKMVLEDPKEDLHAGWTLACPHEANTLRTTPFEECILLLTDVALYFCRFDWITEKVGQYERVDLRDITEIWRGAYIIDTLGPTHTDETKNVGFALRYLTKGQAVIRTNTRSMQNEKTVPDEKEDDAKKENAAPKGTKEDETRLLAFKAPPPRSAARNAEKDTAKDEADLSELEQTKQICDEIHKVMTAAMRKTAEADHLELTKLPQVEERDVISLMEARKNTGYMESLGYGLKRMIWAWMTYGQGHVHDV